ncbi:MAG: HD domain-containing phosphohydrolase [Candidatus Omnitrophota bacterium]
MSIKNYSILTKRYKTVLSTIHAAYRLINSSIDLNSFLVRFVKLICQFLNADYCLISLIDNTKKYIFVKIAVDSNKKHIITRRSRIKPGIEERVIRTCSCVNAGKILAVPLIAEDVIGVIIIKRNKPTKPFNQYEQELLMALSEQAVMAIRNLRLYEEQQKVVLGSIKSLVMLMDTKVPSAYTHTPYFSKLVLAIGQKLQLSEEQLRSLEYASLLHDAGKINIPLEILAKTTKLTGREYRIIKLHPSKGVAIIKPLQALRPVIPIILHHHEKYDGTGYPSRLKKGQIPLGSRIMAVADAFDAMVFGRPYRDRISFWDAIEEIKRNSGTQFDPKVVEAFLKLIKEPRFKKYLQLSG